MKVLLVSCLLVMGIASAAADPFTDAETRFYASLVPKDTGNVEIAPDALLAMWQRSPTRTLASLEQRTAGNELAITLIAMSGHGLHDPRFADFLIKAYDRVSPLVQADIVRALAPFDGADDHVEAFLRRVLPDPIGAPAKDQAVAALDRIERRRLGGLGTAETLIAEVAKADVMTIADSQFLQGLWVLLDGEVLSEGAFRTMVGGTRVVVSFTRDDEARAAYAPAPDAWVRLQGPIRSIHPAADSGGKFVEIELSYAALSASTAPRVRTTPAVKSGCGCSGGDGAPSLALVLLAVAIAVSVRVERQRDR